MPENLPISVYNSCFLPQKSRNLLDFGDFHNLPGKSVSVPGFSQNLPAFYPENTRHGPARPARLKKTMVHMTLLYVFGSSSGNWVEILKIVYVSIFLSQEADCCK